MPALAFTHANLYDGLHDSPLQQDVTLLVEVTPRGGAADGTITAIGPSAEVPVPAGAEVHDLCGKYVVPGLINAHSHLFGTGRPSSLTSMPEGVLKFLIRMLGTRLGKRMMMRSMRRNAVTSLHAGVTTLRTVGDFNYLDVAVREEIEAGAFLGSRLVVAGVMICVTGGHGDLFSHITDSPWEGRRAVRHCLRHGSDLIKILSTGGVMDARRLGEAGRAQMTVEEISAICDEAHRGGFKVAAHVESTLGIKEALLGGVDSIEHGAPIPDELVPMFKDNPRALDGCTVLVPTISAGLDLNELGQDVLKVPEVVKQNAEIIRDGMIAGLRKAVQAGIPLGMGTDSSVPFVPHYEFWRELVYYQHFAGVSPCRAIHIATAQNARLLGVDDVTGTLEEGKSADFLVLDSNPLDDLTALAHIRHVVQRGSLIREPRYEKLDVLEENAAGRYFEKHVASGEA